MEGLVHEDHAQKNLVQHLVDRLMGLCFPSYTMRGECEYINHTKYLKHGVARVIKTILWKVYVEHGKEDVNDERRTCFNFVRVGHLSRIGYKLGKVVDCYLYQYHPSEAIKADDADELRAVMG